MVNMNTTEELKDTLAYGCRVLAFSGQSDITTTVGEAVMAAIILDKA